MALTKVSGGILDPGINVAGIVTATGFDGPFTGGSTKNITAGIITATGFDLNGNGDISGNLVIGGNLTANGDFTTLNTTLREVEILRVDANTSAIAGIITQSGSGHALYVDGTTILGNSQYVPTFNASTQLVVSQLSGNSNSVDMTILGGRAGKSIIRFGDQDSNNRGSIQYHHTNESFNFYNNGNTSDPRLTIASNGNVGVNTTDASNQLTVFAKSGSSVIARFKAFNGNSNFDIHTDASSHGQAYVRNNIGAIKVQLNSNGASYFTGGEVLIGTTTDANVKLDVEGSLRAKSTGYVAPASGTGLEIYYATNTLNDTPSGYLISYDRSSSAYKKINYDASEHKFRTSGTERLIIEANGDIKVTGNKAIYFGESNDLMVGHDGSSTRIEDSYGFLAIKSNALELQTYTGGEVYAKFTRNGAAELYHNNLLRLETDANGVQIKPNVGGVTQLGIAQTTTTAYSINGSISFINSSNTTAQIQGRTGAASTTGDIIFLCNTVGDESLAILEDGKVRVPDRGMFVAGNGNDLKIFHDSSANNNVIEGHLNSLNLRNYNVNSTDIVLSARRNIILQTNLNETGIQCLANGATEIFYDGGATPKLRTTATGIEALGEVAASQDYPNIRPVLDFNFAATKKLKPEMSFARAGEASFHDGVGSVKFVGDNEPRFEHDIVTGECKGLMFEQAGTNYSYYSRRFNVTATGSWVKLNSASITADTHTAPDGTSSGVYMADTLTGADGTAFNGNVLRQYVDAGAGVKHTFSIYIKLITSTQATIYIRDGATGSTSSANAIPNTRNWQRVVVTSSAALTNGTTHAFYVGNTNGTIAVWGSQIERTDYVTSYIRQTGATNGTRNTDKGVHLDGEDVTDIFNQGEGTLIAEAILTQSVSNNPIVGFYEDFGSNNRLELRGDASSVGTARFEAVVGGSGQASLTPNLTHSGVNNVSKYAYAFQENNYAGCVNGGSVTTDTSGTFPHGTGIDSMMIGEAVYNTDAAVIVKRIMYYADRLPNSQLVTLTS